MNSHIPRILEATRLSFGAITERYGGSVSVFIAPGLDDFQFLDDELNEDDTPAVEMQSYLGGNAGVRFPQGSGDTYDQAMAQLESLLETLQPHELEAWGAEVRKAYASLREAKATGRNSPWWVSTAFREGRLTAVN